MAQASARTWLPRAALGTVWMVLPPILAFVYVATLVQFPLDYWPHVCAGRQIAESGSTGLCDVFTYTIAGEPIVNQSWLAQWTMYLVQRAGGFSLAQFLCALMYAASIALASAAAWRRCQNPRIVAAVATIAFGVSLSNLGVRPQAISPLLFAAELLLLWNWGDRRITPLLAAAMELLWTNTHGAFPLGIALPGLFLAGTAVSVFRQSGMRGVAADRRVRVYLAAAGLSLAAAFCTPQFRHALGYVFTVSADSAQRGIGEWLAPDIGTFTGAAFFLSVAVTVAILVPRWRRVEATELLLLAAFGLLAFRAQRMVMWWGLALAPVLARHLDELLAPRVSVAQPPSAVLIRRTQPRAAVLPSPERPTTFNALAIVALLVFALMCTPWTRTYNRLLPAAKRADHAVDEPRAAVEYLRRIGFSGRVFHPMEWGGYLCWRLYPEVKIFNDIRIESYTDALWNDYVATRDAGPSWQTTLDRYRVDCLVWDPAAFPALSEAMGGSSQWQKVPLDGPAEVYLRRN